MPHGSADCGLQAARRPRPQAPRPGRAPWPSPSPGPARPQVQPPFLAGLSFLRSHIQVEHAAFVPVWRGRPRGCRRRGARPPGGCAASGGDCVLITRLRLAEETAAWTCGQLSDRAPSRRPGVMSFRRTPRGGPARPEADPLPCPCGARARRPAGLPATSRRLATPLASAATAPDGGAGTPHRGCELHSPDRCEHLSTHLLAISTSPLENDCSGPLPVPS